MPPIYSNLFPDPGAARSEQHSASIGGARIRSQAIIVITGDAAAGDVVYLTKLPSGARILNTSDVYYDAIAGATEVDIGFGGVTGADADALWDGQSMAAAGNKKLTHATATVAMRFGKVWQMAGLAEDPGGAIDLIATLVTEVTASGQFAVNLLYVVDS